MPKSSTAYEMFFDDKAIINYCHSVYSCIKISYIYAFDIKIVTNG